MFFLEGVSMNLSLGVQKTHGSVPTAHYDAVVIGAGPYGLSTAAHLQGRGLKIAIFGKPLKLWREHMPSGMLLRSYWWATNLSDPEKKYGLEQYFEAENQHEIDPFPIESFINYGLWFQKHAVPNVDETYVTTIERKDGQFLVTLADGRIVQAPAVVMAPGLHYYVYRPAEYDHMPAELVSHTDIHYSFDRFIGKRVVVIGGGQSALETAALLNESGAEVQLVTRSPLLWLKGDSMSDRSFIKRLRYPKAGIAPGWFNWGLEYFPYTFQRLPRSVKDRLLRGRASYGPAGAHWLKDRILGKVALHELQRVQEIKEVDGEVVLTLSNQQVLTADHVFLGTGYRVDIKKLPMLHPLLLSEIQTYREAPVLNNQFETNIPGLYFVGFSTVFSCGPLFRFVVGTDAAARRVAGAVARQAVHVK
jgi:thioredoxin reductase